MGSNCSSNKSSQVSVIGKTAQVPGLKVAVIGDLEVGKSCVLDRYLDNAFSPLYIPTKKLALRSVVRKLNIPGHATVPVTFWDIPGKEDLDIHQSYFRNLDAVIVVVDASRSLSIETAKLWRLAVIANATFSSHGADNEISSKETGFNNSNKDPNSGEYLPSAKTIDDIPFLLLGNKKDLIGLDGRNDCGVNDTDNREVESDTGTTVESVKEAAQMMDDLSQDFVGSVLVSAKSNDLSVHSAIQNFLRHVLEKRFVEKRWKSVEKMPKVKKQRYEFEPQLQTTGIIEIDEEFSKADEILHRVKALHCYQRDSLVKFADQCVAIDVIDSTKNASMQNCLVALRIKLQSLDLKLKLVLVDDLFTLEVKADAADRELETNLRYAIKTFNKEYVAVTLAMLKEYPLAQSKLSSLDEHVEKLCLQFKVPPVSTDAHPVTSTDLHRKSLGVERNRAKMRHTIHECEESLAAIRASVKQVKTAFVW